MKAGQDKHQPLIELFQGGTKLNFKKGEYIIRPGEAFNSIYFIDDGLVKAFTITKYGEENLLSIRKKHEVFPLIWAITGKEKDVVFQTLGPTTVWRINHDDYLAFLNNHPDALPIILEFVTEMYRLHSERILNLTYRSVRERLISFLLTMSDRFGEEAEEGIVIKVPLKHQDIASSINASRETASRELSYLERKGLIGQKQSLITLKNVEGLRAYL